jgi:lipopolysaccharide/colanic/teichoic acid biosynthesis glycosyltransferase
MGKRCFDFGAASVLLILAAPIFLIIWLLNGLDGSRTFYLHRRIGREGRPFDCWKFRTMVVDAEQRLQQLLQTCPESRGLWEKYQKLPNDPRVTPWGVWMRKSSLDELPQLINVLRGEMSLVGPRPITSEELAHYGDRVSEFLSVRPGITGLAQVGGRSRLTLAQRVEIELYYVRHRSFWLDVRVLIKTVWVVLIGLGAH